MRKIISLGMNCEVSFQIEKYVEAFNASLFSWAFVLDDELFLKALENIDDIFENEICFHLPTDDMFMDRKYQITFHGRTPKQDFLLEDGRIKDRKLYEETVLELKSRIRHLKEKFKEQLLNDHAVYIKKIMIEPDLETYGGKEKVLSIIKRLAEIILGGVQW